jgi:hypothetical protein
MASPKLTPWRPAVVTKPERRLWPPNSRRGTADLGVLSEWKEGLWSDIDNQGHANVVAAGARPAGSR